MKKIPILPIKTVDFISHWKDLNKERTYEPNQWIEYFEPGQQRWIEVLVKRDLGKEVLIIHPAEDLGPSGYAKDATVIKVDKEDTRPKKVWK